MENRSVNAQMTDMSCLLRDRIEQCVGPQKFKVWFHKATQITVTEDVVRVGVPNQFIGAWIEQHYGEAITAAARDLLQREVRVVYVLEPSLAGRVGRTQVNDQAACLSRIGGRSGNHLSRGDPSVPSRSLRGRLDTFVVGACNRLAYNAALAIAEARTVAPSPLFLHSASGLGKTHLLHAIYNALVGRDRSTDPPSGAEAYPGGNGHANGQESRVACLYVSAEEFTNQFIFAVQKRQVDAFRRRFRRLDVLLIDDVHFLANKKGTQEEFLHTFNTIDAAGKRVVLASDAHPRMIGQMSESLISRFVAGMVVRLEPPDIETRRAILRQRVAEMRANNPLVHLRISDAIIEYIAENVQMNVRELEGALLRVAAVAAMSDAPLTVAMARECLDSHVQRTARMVTAEAIETAVATFFGLTTLDLHTSRKYRTISLARSIAMFLARRHTELSFPEIARLMGNKNHATVLLACRRIEETLNAQGSVRYLTAAGPREAKLADVIRSLEEQISV